MITLEPMQQDDLENLVESEIKGYAEDHVRNGNWPQEGSLERARKEFETLLPHGIHTPNQYLWTIMDGSVKVGLLWVQVKDNKAFIYDFLILEEYRGRGYGKQALSVLDDKLKTMNVNSVGLHVFGDNIIAQELYKKMGFVVSGINMQKKYR